MTTYIDQSKIFAHLDRMAAWRNGETPAPVTIEWDLSNRCSRGCAMCHFAYTHTRGPLASRDKGGTEGTGDLADAVLVKRALGEAKAAGVQGIIWTGGGEPTLHPQFDVIVQHAHDLGLEQGMYTHGGHIDLSRAIVLRRLFTWVVVSLDRADEASYAAYKGRGFGASCAGIRNLTTAPGPCTVGVSFLLDGSCWRDAPRMLKLARSLGADYTTFRPMIHFDVRNPGQATDDRQWITEAAPMLQELATHPDVACDVPRFLEYRDWIGRSYPACYGIRHTTTITPDGRMWVCPNRRGFAGSCLGDLKEESFASIWARHPRQWTDFAQCRVMCRLHLMNEVLAHVEAPRVHTAFV